MPILSGNNHAHSFARLNVLRLGASRLDYYQPWFKVTINGVDQTTKIRIDGGEIVLNLDAPHSATLRVSGLTPVQGQEIRIYMGDEDVAHLLFAGHILQSSITFEGVPENVAYDLSCIDYRWRLDTRKIIGTYTNQSASAIITDILANYTSGFTVVHVEQDLPTIDEITFTNEDVTKALDRIVQRIGGYWYPDFGKDIHAFLTQNEITTTIQDTSAGNGVEDAITSAVDLSQTRTRVWSRGGGSNASTDVDAGANTLPVEEGVWYSANGGMVECGTQRITYTGLVDTDGSTSLPIVLDAPRTPSVAQANSGTPSTYVTGALQEGTYLYRVTFANSTVEGVASQAATLIVAPVASPNIATTNVQIASGGSMANGTYGYKFSYYTADGETLASGSLSVFTDEGAVDILHIPTSSDARVTGRRIYRTKKNGSSYFLLRDIANNSVITGDTFDFANDVSLGPAMPTSAALQTGQGKLSSIETGPAGTTSRKIYRTTRNGSTFALLTTIGDNTTTTYTDNVADTSLGATMVAVTAGVSAGDTSIEVLDLAQLPASGWVRVDNNLVLYTGRSANTGDGFLTGIPATGMGAVLVNVPNGAAVVVEPHLTGVSGILYPIKSGDEVNVLTMSEDTDAQDALATAIGSGDGIVEDFIDDGRLSLTETQAHGDAQLAQLKDPLTTVTFSTRDQTFRPGRSVTFSVTQPAISGTLKVQQVTISDLNIGGSVSYVFPLRKVEASSRRYSLEGLIRALRA